MNMVGRILGLALLILVEGLPAPAQKIVYS